MKAERSSILGVIPSRFNSTRLEGKPLMKIGDKTMIQHVYENCATILEHLVVATDDQRIFDAVEAFNGNAVMTNKAHLTEQIGVLKRSIYGKKIKIKHSL